MSTATAVSIATRDGVADADLMLPAGDGTSPGVLFLMDGLGVRPALRAMAARLAGHGYAVLLPNLYYRSGPYAPFDAATALSDPGERERLFALFGSIDGNVVMRDAQAYLTFLAQHPRLERGPVHCVGYCMGGGLALLAAGTFPERIVAAASIHGANLATDRESSPHRLASRMRARVYVAVAERDPWLVPDETQNLRAALEAAGVEHRIEVYEGVEHGFAVNDLPVYDAAAAETHWQRVLELFR
jgi:carboxymethylenebutenolidase